MENSQEQRDQLLMEAQQVKMEWIKPEIMELVTKDGTTGSADAGADVGQHEATS